MSQSTLQFLDHDPTHGRLRHTRTFRGEGFVRWCDALVGIVGVGNVGWRVLVETIRSGASAWIVDPDFGSLHSDTQFAAASTPKVLSAIAACDAIQPGRVTGVQADVRQVGVGEFSRLSVLVDCSDDPALAIGLTKISNGLGLPLIRVALDGSGELELGRVQCSHGGAGHACQLCTYSIADLFRYTRRTPCPAGAEREAANQPTLAGGALGSVAAGIALLWMQRLVTGNDVDQVHNHELIFDLSGSQMFALDRSRSPRCVSGHARWQLERLDACAESTTFDELFTKIESRLGEAQFSLEPWLHPLCVEAACTCGHWQAAVGTPWRTPPRCERCGAAMHWFRQTALARVTREIASDPRFGQPKLAALGLPERGAMFVAHAPHQPPRHFVLT